MKRFFFPLLLMCSISQAQQAFTDYFHVKNTASIDSVCLNRPFLTSTSDTTYSVNIKKYSSVVLAFQAQDTSTFLIYYRLGLQDATYSAWTLVDSAKITSAVVLTPKAVTLSTVAAGASFIQFYFKADTKAFAFGTGTKKYTATLKTIQ